MTRLIHRSQGCLGGQSTEACRFGFRDPCWNSLLAYSLDLESGNSSNNKDKRQLLVHLEENGHFSRHVVSLECLTLKALGSRDLSNLR